VQYERVVPMAEIKLVFQQSSKAYFLLSILLTMSKDEFELNQLQQKYVLVLNISMTTFY